MIIWGAFITLSNMQLQLRILLEPQSITIYYFNIGYMINSLVCMILYFIGWVKPRCEKVSFIAFLLTTLRLIFKMMDFEGQFEVD